MNFQKQINQQLKREHAQERPNFRERAADKVAAVGGSWVFIFGFTVFFFSWIAFNVFIYTFDEFPFILLNLILSCLAIFQAPFILMSQNRMSQIDRKREERAYKVELENRLQIQALDDRLEEIEAILTQLTKDESCSKH